MRKLIVLLFLVSTLTSCQHLVRFVDTTSSVRQNKTELTQSPKIPLYYTFRVLDKSLNLVYIEQFQNPKAFFYRDISELQVLDTLQWASETPYQLGK
jgi:hypothetical protein